MKKLFFFSFLFISSVAYAQFDLSIQLDNGLSRFKNYNKGNVLIAEIYTTIYSPAIGITAGYQPKNSLYKFNSGLMFRAMGKTMEDWILPDIGFYKENMYYLTIPIEAEIKVFKKFKGSLSFNNSLLIYDNMARDEITSGDPYHLPREKYEAGVGLGIKYQLNQFHVGIEMHQGITTITPFEKQPDFDPRLYNQAVWLTLEYKLHSF
jgi:hypothetical protein